MPKEITIACLTVVSILGLPGPAAGGESVEHPNLMLNREEIQQAKARLEKYEWAAEVLEKVKQRAEDRHALDAALAWVFTGEDQFAETAHDRLLHTARRKLRRYEETDVEENPGFGNWGGQGSYAWAYDLTYDLFSQQEREEIEQYMRTAARRMIEAEKIRTTTPNLVFEKHFKVGLIGFCLGEQKFIDWALRDPGAHGPARGGFFPVMDNFIKDGPYWGEAPIYALGYDIYGMLALAEASKHYGGPDLYGYVSEETGASIKRIIDGYLRMLFPREEGGEQGGIFRMATFGDGSTSYSPQGKLQETYLFDSRRGQHLAGCLEIAYAHYGDSGYAWILSHYPRDARFSHRNRSPWSYPSLTHGLALPEDPTPPAAPSGVYESQGFAMVRADESSSYWTSGEPAAMLRLGQSVGHGHQDYFSLVLHGAGRLLYPDLNVIQYEPTFLNWTQEGIAHNTLLVDHTSPQPGPVRLQRDFTEDVKFVSVSGQAFKHVSQTRSLLVTDDYLADFFRASDTRGRERTFDWVLHGLGNLYPGNPEAYQASERLIPHYWWVYNERSRNVETAWQADWIQRSAGITKGLQFTDAWFDDQAGVRMTMLGSPKTRVFCGDGPLTNGPPYPFIEGNREGSSPMIVVRRQAPQTVFAAVHDPYEQEASVQDVESLESESDVTGMKVRGKGYTDYLVAGFGEKTPQTVTAGEEIVVTDKWAYIRRTDSEIRARGPIRAFRIKSGHTQPSITLRLNGKKAKLRRQKGSLIYGELPKERKQDSDAEVTRGLPPAERKASLHYRLLPEEIHLSAQGDEASGQTSLHLRCVGRGKAKGRLQFEAPEGLRIEPKHIGLDLASGETRTVELTVRRTADIDEGLYSVRMIPEKRLRAAGGSIPVSGGVVISFDNTRCRTGQYTIRAPGYTMKVDEYSGTSLYLLDGQGRRRYGKVQRTDPAGFGAIRREDTWTLKFGQRCRFVWEGDDHLTIGGQGTRVRWQFHEDRIVFSLAQFSKPGGVRLNLGNFDYLERPKGVSSGRRKTVTAERLFFPHNLYSDGVLAVFPSKRDVELIQNRALQVPLKRDEKISIRFTDEQEMPASE